MSTDLSELNAAMPAEFKVVYHRQTECYVVISKFTGLEVLRRNAEVVNTWRRGNRGAVLAAAVRYALRRQGRKAG